MNGLLLGLALVAGPFPDALDVLGAGRSIPPRIALILDSSGSMRNGARATRCSHFASRYHGGNQTLNKNEMMRAVLTGCESEGDGILDRWADTVEFSIHRFGKVLSDFGDSSEAHQTQALSVRAKGGTPLTRAIEVAGRYIDRFASDANTPTCQPHYIVLMSDGNPNGGAKTMKQDCTPPAESRRVSANEPWWATEYLYDRHPDVLCDVSGNQSIKTHTLGFGAPGSFDPANLQRMAEEGGGTYLSAATIPELANAFDTIMQTVSTGGRRFAAVEVARDGYFSANRAYVNGYASSEEGPWIGNVRRLCVLPTYDPASGRYDTGQSDCMFRSPDGQALVTNPDAQDAWTGLPAAELASGGVAARLRAALGGTPTPPYWSHRNLVTWRAGQAGWVPIRPDTWSEDDAWAHGCHRSALINHLHGYAGTDCDTGEPTKVRSQPLGATVEAPVVELAYGEDCSVGSGEERGCFLLFPTNDGILHVVDARTGNEVSGIVPAELWSGRFANSRLSELFDQPGVRYAHRYYLDGGIRLWHEDADGDGIIDAGEAAEVYVALGRGGRVLYALDVSAMADGVVDDGTPIRTVVAPAPGTAFERVAELWSAPVPARMNIGGAGQDVLLLVAGHEPRFDVVEPVPDGETPIPYVEEGSLGTLATAAVSCGGGGGVFGSVPCGVVSLPGCLGNPSQPCYDGLGVPQAVTEGPYEVADGVHRARRMRFHFSVFDLDPADLLILQDGSGAEVARYTGDALHEGWSAWVYDAQASLRLVTDGVDTADAGYRVDQIQYEVGARSEVAAPNRVAPPVLGSDHHPALFVLAPTAGSAFGAEVSDDALQLMVAAECASVGDACIDASDFPDLAHMKCPMGQEPSIYWKNGEVHSIYLGDECGQIFEISVGGSHPSGWKARRLVHLNDGPVGLGPDHRKLFTRIDVVESMCPGQEVVGLYFGTGNVQRPLATDELEDPAVTDGRELIGVLWVGSETSGNYGVEDFVDATGLDELDPVEAHASGKVGFLLRLGEDERMVVDPLVASQRAYYRTVTPVGGGDVCGSANPVEERIWVFDSCTSAAVAPSGERVAWSREAQGPGDLMLVAPADGGMLISHGDLSTEQSAEVVERRMPRVQLYFWRGLE